MRYPDDPDQTYLGRRYGGKDDRVEWYYTTQDCVVQACSHLDSASEISVFDLSDPVSRKMARFETKPQFVWDPPWPIRLSNRIRAWERRQRNMRWVQCKTAAWVVRYHLCSRCGEAQGTL